MLTNALDPASYEDIGTINGDCRLKLDLRNWDQKFAYYYGALEAPYVAATKRLFVGGAFYDVGASIGLYTVTMAERCRTQGGVVRAIEPVPQNSRRLREQLALNAIGPDRVTLHDVALSDTPGTAEMVLTDSGRPGNAKIVAQGDVQVRVTTLDALWEENGREDIGFVKIDTEGWDAKVILGGREALRRSRPPMLVEFNRERMRNHHIPLAPCWEFLCGELEYAPHTMSRSGNLEPVSEPGDLENLFLLPRARE